MAQPIAGACGSNDDDSVRQLSVGYPFGEPRQDVGRRASLSRTRVEHAPLPSEVADGSTDAVFDAGPREESHEQGTGSLGPLLGVDDDGDDVELAVVVAGG